MKTDRSINKGTKKGLGGISGKRLRYIIAVVFLCVATLFVSTVLAETLYSSQTGTHDGFYYSFWKDSGDASFELLAGGRYKSQWNNSTNNWVGGKGWNPGGPRVVNYEGYYGVDNSQNSYLALYGWTTDPLIEYYVIESYGSYNPATCSGGQDFGSFQSDGATYNVRRCLREHAPCILGDDCTFYQYFSVRSPKKGFGNIQGTVTVQNHFDYWASQGLNLGNFDYMIFATEGYQSSGSSDITVSEGVQPTPTQVGPTPTSPPPGARIEAENYSSSGGTLDVCGTMLCYIEANAWTQYSNISLPSGANKVDLSVANGGNSTNIQVQIGGVAVGTLNVGDTGGWDTFQTQSLTFPAQSGTQDVRLVFVNGNVNVDWLKFSGSGPGPTSTPNGADPNFHIYLMFGQSNMEGQGQISSQDLQVPSGLLVMHADDNCTQGGASYGQWRTATPPLIRCYDVAHSWNNGGLGPGDYFGRTMLENSDPSVTLGLVGAAYQGQSIDFFMKDCAQRGTCQPTNPNGSVPLGQGGYAWLLDLAQRAQQDGVIKGIIFHQGESDTGDPNWPNKVNQVVTDLRNDLGIGNVPFIAGEMVPGACCTSHNTYVHQIESVVSNGYWVSASGLGARDEYHFNAEGYREIGRRYAYKMLEVLGDPTPTPSPTTPPPTTPPPTTPPPTTPPPTSVPDGCTVDYAIQNDWGSGATVNVTIGNGSSSAIDGWTLDWTFANNQQITNLWNGSYTQSGAAVSASNASWNSVIPGNGTVSFGFNLSYSGSNDVPTSFTLNGIPCNGGGPAPTLTPTTPPPTTPPPTNTPTPTPPTPTPAVVFAVNSGGDAYTASDGTTYAADTDYSGGSTYSNDAAISGTTDDVLYNSERYEDFTYAASVPNGAYLVTLHFAETFHTQAGARSFDVLMEGIEQVTDLDIYAEVGGDTAYVTQSYVNVTDGTLNIAFVSNVENAKINAIKVSSVGSGVDPIAVFTINPSTVKPGETVTVDASASFDPNGTITGYQVDYGDGTIVNGAVTTHLYAVEGDYTIMVTVTDDDGQTGSSTKSINVSDRGIAASVENTGADCPIPNLPGIDSLPFIGELPDPFLSVINNARISSMADWRCRRAEIAAQAQAYMFGTKPLPPDSVSGSMNGNLINITVNDNGQSVSFSASIDTPSGPGPFPAMIAIGNSSLNNTILSNMGVAIITFDNDSMGAQNGPSSRGQGTFYQLYGSNHSAGSLMAWAWGVSRLIDALETTPGTNIDVARLGVTGCSRNGKGALIVGAFDERIALTIPQESGSGGTSSFRVSQYQSDQGEYIQTASSLYTEQPWMSTNFEQFTNSVNQLPIDLHEVIGMVAPRGLYVVDNQIDWLGGMVSTPVTGSAAREIWIAMGLEDRMGVSNPGSHTHCVFPSSQDAELQAFVGKYLVGGGSGNTNFNIGPNVDVSSWITWSTPDLQ